MKRFVRLPSWEGPLLGLSSLLLVVVIEKEAAISYLIVFGLAAVMVLQSWARHRRDKRQAALHKPN